MKYCCRWIPVLAVLSLLISLSNGLPEAEAQTVNFPDTNLVVAVRGTLNLGATDPITQTDLARLVILDAGDARIRDLTGLEAATNLYSLNLTGNQIRDISPLSGLTQIEQLGLANNQISDITALSGLTRITWLSIVGNPITDIRPVSNLDVI